MKDQIQKKVLSSLLIEAVNDHDTFLYQRPTTQEDSNIQLASEHTMPNNPENSEEEQQTLHTQNKESQDKTPKTVTYTLNIENR